MRYFLLFFCILFVHFVSATQRECEAVEQNQAAKVVACECALGGVEDCQKESSQVARRMNWSEETDPDNIKAMIEEFETNSEDNIETEEEQLNFQEVFERKFQEALDRKVSKIVKEKLEQILAEVIAEVVAEAFEEALGEALAEVLREMFEEDKQQKEAI